MHSVYLNIDMDYWINIQTKKTTVWNDFFVEKKDKTIPKELHHKFHEKNTQYNSYDHIDKVWLI